MYNWLHRTLLSNTFVPHSSTQSSLYSNLKHHVTYVVFWVVAFISNLWAESISDKEIVSGVCSCKDKEIVSGICSWPSLSIFDCLENIVHHVTNQLF